MFAYTNYCTIHWQKKTRCNNFPTAPILTVQNCLVTLFVWEIMFSIERGRLHIGLFHFSIRFSRLHLRMSQTNKSTVLYVRLKPATGKYYFFHCLHGFFFGPWRNQWERNYNWLLCIFLNVICWDFATKLQKNCFLLNKRSFQVYCKFSIEAYLCNMYASVNFCDVESAVCVFHMECESTLWLRIGF